jgi:RNA polymerase sigma-70 factor (ECF subfamily)
MPPVPLWFVGRQHYGLFMARVFRLRGPDWRMLPTAANGQPAVGAYCRGDQGTYEAHTLQVFSLKSHRISRNVVFQDPRLFELFDLPPTLDAVATTAKRPPPTGTVRGPAVPPISGST